MVPQLTALFAALLFGASAPFAKLLLSDVNPLQLAGLLYLGSGSGLLVIRLGRNIVLKNHNRKVQSAGMKSSGSPEQSSAAVSRRRSRS